MGHNNNKTKPNVTGEDPNKTQKNKKANPYITSEDPNKSHKIKKAKPNVAFLGEKEALDEPGLGAVWVVSTEETNYSWGHFNTESQIHGVYSTQGLAIQAVTRYCHVGQMGEMWSMRNDLDETDDFVDNRHDPSAIDRTGVAVSLSMGDDNPTIVIKIKKVKKDVPMVPIRL